MSQGPQVVWPGDTWQVLEKRQANLTDANMSRRALEQMTNNSR